MADYKGIKGFTIQTIAGDPPAPIEGQVWYNTTSNVLKGYAPVTGAWASGGALNTAKQNIAGAGTQTATLCIGGYGVGILDQSESYNGSTWTEGNNLNLTRAYMCGIGTQTAALGCAGSSPSPVASDEVESYDGTCWTEVADLNTGRGYDPGAAGTQTAGLVFGGGNPTVAITESWDGTSWTEVADMLTAAKAVMSFGTNTAAICAGGRTGPPAVTANTESWDGTSWTEVNNLTTARGSGAGSGIQTAGLAIGGRIAPTASPISPGYTESWDGTSWTEVADLATSRAALGAGVSSPNTLSICFGGNGAPDVSATNTICEEWTAGVSVVTFTSS